jgi:glycosyltransferase involved in cell wall biosynthesis
LNDGGAEAVLYRLIKQDTVCDHQVICLLDEGKYAVLLQEAGIDVQCLNLKQSIFSLGKLLRLRRMIAQAKPDVVQTWMYHSDLFGGIAARLAGIRAVVWGIHHTTLDPQKSAVGTILVARICARLSHFVPARIISCSQRGMEIHKSLGYSKNKLVFLPNGHDTSVFKPDTAMRQKYRKEMSIDDGTLLIGCVARFDPQKDQDNLLHALSIFARSCSSFQALLIGPGVDNNNHILTQLITQLNLDGRVKLLGPISNIPAVMNGIDIHVLPSAFGEAFPNVLCEAMACGTPCVATDVGDSAAIIGDTGESCPPSDPTALSEAMWRCTQRVVREPKLQENCRNRIAQNFSLGSVRDRYHEIWSEAAKIEFKT